MYQIYAENNDQTSQQFHSSKWTDNTQHSQDLTSTPPSFIFSASHSPCSHRLSYSPRITIAFFPLKPSYDAREGEIRGSARLYPPREYEDRNVLRRKGVSWRAVEPGGPYLATPVSVLRPASFSRQRIKGRDEHVPSAANPALSSDPPGSTAPPTP